MKNITMHRILRALTPTRARAGALVAVALAGVLVSSCDVHGISAPGALASITVTPSATLATGTVQQMIAVGRDADGVIIPITPTWSVVASGGSVNATGSFTAGVVLGTFANTVRATSGGVDGFATIVVTSGPIANITVTPNPASLVIGATQTFTAVARDAVGNVLPMTPTWSVVAGGGAINAATGVFTAGTLAGSFPNTVQASSTGVSGFASVNVTAGALATIAVTPNPATISAGATQSFVAVGRDASSNIVAITPVWSVAAGGGTINAASGLFTAGAATGTFTNTAVATSGAISGQATVIVTLGTLATITVTPDPASMGFGQTQRFSAVGRDAVGNVLLMTPTWSVVVGGGTINAVSGLWTAGAIAGTFTNTIRATSGSKIGRATVIVTAAGPPPPIVALGNAAPNGIMAGTAVTCISGGLIAADVSVSPGNTITGFGPCSITGTQHLADGPAAAAQLDLTSAYNALAALPCPPANAIVADLGGTTKPAGVYCTASSIGVTGTLTLDGGGDPNASFVFQAGSALTTAGDIVLINGAQAKNVFWQVGTSATIGTASQWQGNIVALTSITFVDSATLLGRALARNGAVSLGTNNVITLP